MKLDIDKEWCLRMAQIEGDAEIGAGRLAVDTVFDDEAVPGVADGGVAPDAIVAGPGWAADKRVALPVRRHRAD